MSQADELRSLVARIADFSTWSHADRIRLFAWAQHGIRKKDRFGTGDINWCYSTLSLARTNVSEYLSAMEDREELLKDGRGYYVEGGMRAKYDTQYGEHDITLNIRQRVKDLINQVPDIAEKDIMKEAEICLHHDAGRATIIMVWNISFYHLCQFILKHHLRTFNDRIPIRYPRKWAVADLPVIQKYDDFGDEMSEREVIEVCNSAGIINGDLFKILVEKLGKRNSAAHPSTVRVSQLQAEAFIDELITNVVLALPI